MMTIEGQKRFLKRDAFYYSKKVWLNRYKILILFYVSTLGATNYNTWKTESDCSKSAKRGEATRRS